MPGNVRQCKDLEKKSLTFPLSAFMKCKTNCERKGIKIDIYLYD